MSKKFDKNRSVDWRYLHVPLKYITNFKGGSNCDRADRYRKETYEEWKEDMIKHFSYIYDSQEVIDKELTKECFEHIQKWEDENGYLGKRILVKEGRDKSLCIIDFYGKNALVAWRNNKTCKVGMTRLCPCYKKKNQWYIKYKDKEILISNNSGWVF